MGGEGDDGADYEIAVAGFGVAPRYVP